MARNKGNKARVFSLPARKSGPHTGLVVLLVLCHRTVATILVGRGRSTDTHDHFKTHLLCQTGSTQGGALEMDVLLNLELDTTVFWGAPAVGVDLLL